MAKKATGRTSSSGTGSSGRKTGSKAVTRTSSSSGGKQQSGFDASDAFVKLLQSPLVAELVAIAATSALGALAAHGFTGGGTRGKRAGGAVKAAGKAAAKAVTDRLRTEVGEIRSAAKAKGGAKA